MDPIARKILLTGLPSCGKTTVITSLAEFLKHRKIAGFYTCEIRSQGRRTGFAIRTFSGVEGILSSTQLPHGPRVGKYRVDVEGFESLVLPELTAGHAQVDVFIIDEIGKMECFSRPFIHAVDAILQGSVHVVATIASKGGGFIARAKTFPEIEIMQVTTANRNELPQKIARLLEPAKDA